MLDKFTTLSTNELQKISGGKFSISINISATLHEVEDGVNGFVDGVTGKKRHYRKNS